MSPICCIRKAKTLAIGNKLRFIRPGAELLGASCTSTRATHGLGALSRGGDRLIWLKVRTKKAKVLVIRDAQRYI